MPIPLYLIKTDCPPHDQLRLLDAWEDWGIPREQQWRWVVQVFGTEHVNDLTEYLTYETIDAKDKQLELPFAASSDTNTNASAPSAEEVQSHLST